MSALGPKQTFPRVRFIAESGHQLIALGYPPTAKGRH